MVRRLDFWVDMHADCTRYATVTTVVTLRSVRERCDLRWALGPRATIP